MAIQTFRPTALTGQVYLRRYGTTDPLRAIGNCSKLDESVEEETKSLKDYTKPGGGEWATLRRVSSMNLAATLHDLDAKALALVRYGADSAVALGSVAEEKHTARQGGLVLLAHPRPASVVITSGAGAWAASTVTAKGTFVLKTSTLYEATTGGTTAGTEPEWPTEAGTVTDGTVVWTYRGAFAAVKDTDYEVRPEGIMILEKGIPDGCPIRVAYSYAAYDLIEILTGAPQDYEVVFGGLNEANSESPVRLTYYKCQVSAAKTISWIGDDFAALEVEMRVQADPKITATGKSRYCKVQMA